MVLDVDNGAGGHDVTFYTASSIEGPWNQLGSVVTNSGSRTLNVSSEPLSVGANSAGVTPFSGRVYSVQVRDGIDGITVAHPRFDEQEIGTSSFNERPKRRKPDALMTPGFGVCLRMRPRCHKRRFRAGDAPFNQPKPAG
jgi:hypothetical protein